MMTEIVSTPERSEQIESCCLALFERWCAARRVVPLAYLMHAWPMAAPTPHLVKRLSRTLENLLQSCPESLDVEDRRLIGEAISMAGEAWRWS